MGIINEWQKKLKDLRESPFPQFEEPPVINTLGGINQPSKTETDQLPVIDVDDETNHCSFDCDALKELLNWAGADQSEVDNIVSKAKQISKQFGIIKSEHLTDIMKPTAEEPNLGPRSLEISQVTPSPTWTTLSNRQVHFKENLENVMNNEDVEIIKKKEEKEY